MAQAVLRAAAGVMAGGRGGGGPSAKVSNQDLIAVVFFFFFSFLFSSSFRFLRIAVFPSRLCFAYILYNIMSLHTSVFWPSSKEGAQVYRISVKYFSLCVSYFQHFLFSKYFFVQMFFFFGHLIRGA